jgi:protein-S-isoprenylcysteine O-methyltransferase Ste14
MLPGVVYGSATLLQVVLIFFLYNFYQLIIVNLVGWALLILFLIIGALPRIEFKKKGEIEKGKSFLSTTKLVSTGIYSVIRHPYWLSWILLSLSLTLMSQHWLMVFLGILACSLIYGETYLLDKRLVQKFGADYSVYKKKVPRLNLLYGLVKKALTKNRS